MTRHGAGCPHPDIRFCPLYVASHDARLDGCCDGAIADGCRVARGVDAYAALAGRLAAAGEGARIIARCAFGRDAEAARDQRRRNMRQAGIQ